MKMIRPRSRRRPRLLFEDEHADEDEDDFHRSSHSAGGARCDVGEKMWLTV